MPVAFLEIQFPVDIAMGTLGGPQYSTRVITVSSGSEIRIQNWENAKLMYQIGYTANPTDMASILAFFRAVKGQTYGWRLKDWSDYQATLEPLVNPMSGTTLQLIKTYRYGGYSEVRTINKPCNNGTFQLFYNGTLQSSSGYTVDYTTGIITLTSLSIGSGMWTWTGEFDTPVRFNQDNLEFTQDNVGKRTLTAIPVIELFIS